MSVEKWMRRAKLMLFLAVTLTGCVRTGRGSVNQELQYIWTVYLEPVRASQEAELASKQLRSLLDAEKRFQVVNSPDNAQAIIRVNIGFERPNVSEGEPSMIGELTPRGRFQGYQPPTGSISVADAVSDRVIWTAAYRSTRSDHRRWNPPPQTIVTQVVSQLSAHIHRSAGERLW